MLKVYHLIHYATTPQKKTKPGKGQPFLTAMFKKSNVSQSASAPKADDPMEGGSEELPLSSEAPSGTPSPTSHEPELGAKSKDVENERTKPPARQLVSSWFKIFPWLVYNEETRTMFCSVCMNDGVAKNSFTRGCGNLRKSALSEHAETSDHKRALQTPMQVQNRLQAEKKSAPIVDKEATRREWKELKETVNAQHYPRDNFAKLCRFHKESFPNLSKLAQIALVLPVHTADVERGFSNQNIILTA